MARTACRLTAAPAPAKTALAARAAPCARRATPGNQALLRARPKCSACAAEDEKQQATARVGTMRADTGAASGPAPATSPAAPAGAIDVWGLPVTRSMCGCRDRIRASIAWANTAAASYAACDTPANVTGTDVETCFSAANPSAVVVAETDSSGTMHLPAASADPCDRIDNKSTFVHETMHARHADDMARAQGPAFFQAWQKLTGDPDRLNKLRAAFPAQVTAFEAQWNNGHDWAQDEVHSYTWERRFLEDALRALNRLC